MPNVNFTSMLLLYTTPQSMVIIIIKIGAPIRDSQCIPEHGGVDWCGGLACMVVPVVGNLGNYSHFLSS